MFQLGVFVAEEALKSQIPIGGWHWSALFYPGNFHFSLSYACLTMMVLSINCVCSLILLKGNWV